METIKSNLCDLVWNVISKELRQVGKKKQNVFTVECEKCGYRRTGQKSNIQNAKTCAGCAKKPAALKTDEAGNCIAICEIGTVEFIRGYQEKYQVSERAAVRQFIETVKAHLPADDPVVEKMSEESINSKVRRATGKKKDRPKACGGSPQNSEEAGRNNQKSDDQSRLTSERPQRYSVAAEPAAIQRFLDKYLPGYQLVKETALNGQNGSNRKVLNYEDAWAEL